MKSLYPLSQSDFMFLQVIIILELVEIQRVAKHASL